MKEIRLCDINRVLFRIAKSKNWKVLVREKYTDNLGFRFYFLVYFLPPNFFTRDLQPIITFFSNLDLNHPERRYCDFLRVSF